MIELTTTWNENKGRTQIKRMLRKTKKIMDEVFREMILTGEQMRNGMIRNMVGTSRAPWSTTSGGATHFPSLPGHPPAIDTGQLVRSLASIPRKGTNRREVEIGSRKGAPYSVFLESGTPNMKQRPFLGPLWLIQRRVLEAKIIGSVRRNI